VYISCCPISQKYTY